jgi:hypothetical protein
VDIQRDQLAALLDGVTEEQARRCLVPSATTLLGLVKHGAWVERNWFEVYIARRGTRVELGMAPDPDASFALTESDTVASVRATFVETCARSRTIAADVPLEHEIDHPRFGSITVRWIHLHLIREFARHAGHGDILREQLGLPG